MADELAACAQQKLADIVKGLHGRLRKRLREANGDHKKVWENHCSNRESLEEYASAMRMLAVNHWTKQSPEGRVEWCYKTALEFFRGGGLKKLMEKQRRRCQFSACAKTCCCCFVEEETGICPDAVYPSEDERLLLLDVGSCFNPFAAFEDIHAVSIDLQPADFMVYKCDFLNLVIQDLPSSQQDCHCRSYDEENENKLSQNSLPVKQSTAQDIHAASHEKGKFVLEASIATSSNATSGIATASIVSSSNATSGIATSHQGEKLLASPTQSILFNTATAHKTHTLCLADFLKEGKEIKILPSRVFHVIVFSLLLSYFPSAVQRWECCHKAHHLLHTNGLLLIITPDSSHQNKNAAMMKSWKIGIESLGFVRWKYEKQTHLHCMAFRKVAPCHSCNHDNGSPEMLYIPQDFQEEEEDIGNPVVSHSEEDSAVIMECFCELPDL